MIVFGIRDATYKDLFLKDKAGSPLLFSRIEFADAYIKTLPDWKETVREYEYDSENEVWESITCSKYFPTKLTVR